MSDRKLTVTEAARHFSDLLNRTYYKGESTILLRSGEPIAKIVPVGGSSILGRDFAAKWKGMRHLDPEDADDFARMVEKSKAEIEMPENPWD